MSGDYSTFPIIAPDRVVSAVLLATTNKDFHRNVAKFIGSTTTEESIRVINQEVYERRTFGTFSSSSTGSVLPASGGVELCPQSSGRPFVSLRPLSNDGGSNISLSVGIFVESFCGIGNLLRRGSDVL